MPAQVAEVPRKTGNFQFYRFSRVLEIFKKSKIF